MKTKPEPHGLNLYDKRGIPILPGDVLEVLHFTSGRNNRKHYMYKHVLESVVLGTEKTAPFLKIGHLSLRDESYYEKLDGRILHHVKILQGFGSDGLIFTERERVNIAASKS